MILNKLKIYEKECTVTSRHKQMYYSFVFENRVTKEKWNQTRFIKDGNNTCVKNYIPHYYFSNQLIQELKDKLRGVK